MKTFHKVLYSTSEWFCHAKYDGTCKAKRMPRTKNLVSTELEDVYLVYFDTKDEAIEFCKDIERKNKKLYP